MMQTARAGLAVILLLITVSAVAYTSKDDGECPAGDPRFVFSWPLGDDCSDRPRGGSSRGTAVVFDPNPHPGWLAVQESGLTKFERDRRAILAMAGPYKASFDFLETVGYSDGFKRDKPYQSWGTEYVYVLEDRDNFISLQHLMVMYFQREDGTVSPPMVMKHWRQDWTYQDDELLVFDHRSQWTRQKVARRDRRGRWSQAVFQVDDSPRYESIGRWRHNASFSTWISDTTRRPLPRREFSVRDDYQVLEGFNRHTVTRSGWVQEEENWKLVVDEAGRPDTREPYLSKEEGLARYRRIVDFNFAPGDRYMELAGPFWADVRREWQQVIKRHKTLKLHEKIAGKPLFVPLFDYAQTVVDRGEYDPQAGVDFIRETIGSYIDK